MFTRELLVSSRAGLHAEVAGALAAIAKNTDVPMFISRLDGRAANLRNRLEVLGLAVQAGETVIVVLKTPDSSIAEKLFAEAQAALK